jgi:muramoyltetrapeptide carboxypeptidase
MNRRALLKSLAALPLMAGAAFGKHSSTNKENIKPKRLMQGDTVGIIAPSSGVSEAEFARALQNMADLGFRVKTGKFAKSVNGFIAGTDKERLEDCIGRLKIRRSRPSGAFAAVMARPGFCPASTTI